MNGNENRQTVYTLLLLGGRQPLCGKGVTSRIMVTSMPEVVIDLMAASRPEPGPFTNTSTLFKPASAAVFAASVADTWAAYGVFFLEPRKPDFPAEDQDITCPAMLVKETKMLLKLALIKALPSASTFTIRFFTIFFFVAFAISQIDKYNY